MQTLLKVLSAYADSASTWLPPVLMTTLQMVFQNIVLESDPVRTWTVNIRPSPVFKLITSVPGYHPTIASGLVSTSVIISKSFWNIGCAT
jgi:hypothetical protein